MARRQARTAEVGRLSCLLFVVIALGLLAACTAEEPDPGASAEPSSTSEAGEAVEIRSVAEDFDPRRLPQCPGAGIDESLPALRSGPFYDGGGGTWAILSGADEPQAKLLPQFELRGVSPDGSVFEETAVVMGGDPHVLILRAGVDNYERVAIWLNDFGFDEGRAVGAMIVTEAGGNSFIPTDCVHPNGEMRIERSLGDRTQMVLRELPLTAPGNDTIELTTGQPVLDTVPPVSETLPPVYEKLRMVFVVTADKEYPDHFACFRSPQVSWGEQVKCITPSKTPIRYQATTSTSREMNMWVYREMGVPEPPLDLTGILTIPEDAFNTSDRLAVRVHLIGLDEEETSTFEVLAYGDAETLDFWTDPLWKSEFETLRPDPSPFLED